MIPALDLFERFKSLNVLIVGDVMIDRYISGDVHRISPEAPVPVIQLKETEDRLGGAANVALNIRALGATPYLCSVIGSDADGEKFLDLLAPQGISGAGILQSSDRVTTVKTRVMAGAQHLLRIDREITRPLLEAEETEFIQQVGQVLEREQIQVVLFQDYNKGVLTPTVIQALIAEAHSRNIPTTVDPKFHHFWAYQQVTLFKPNLKEIRAQLTEPVLPTLQSLQYAATQIRHRLQNTYTMITLSEHGIFLENGEKSIVVPTQPRSITDVSGAGDTVISIVSLGVALGLSLEDLGILGNLAGGQVCEHVGVVPVNTPQLLQEYMAFQKST